MAENQDQPAGDPLQPQEQAREPGSPGNARRGFLSTASERIRRAVPKGVPGARPRRTFDIPPDVALAEDGSYGGDGEAEDTPPRAMNAHPIHFGFMFTVGVGMALLVYFILTNVGELLVWIGAALFIAIGLDPIVSWLAARRVPRPAGIAITILGLAGVVAGFFSMLIPTIVQQTSEIVSKAPGYVDSFLESDFFVNIEEQFHVRERIEEEVNKFFTNADALGGVFGGVLSVGTVIANGLFGALIILVLTLYFLSSLPAMKKWGYRLAPRTRRRRVEALSEEITGSVGNYVIGQGIVALLDATYAFVVIDRKSVV